jgi:hypothetical protein
LRTVVLSAFNVANFPEGGGHFWVYMQYALGLRQCGCEVYWLERFITGDDASRDAATITAFLERLAGFGLKDHVILLAGPDPKKVPGSTTEVRGLAAAEAEAVFRRADLLLNFHYAIDPELLGRFRRTALVDIDPGLLQFWISRKQLSVPSHDAYFTTGETVGEANARFPDCGLPWVKIRPAVCLERWPYTFDPSRASLTTVSAWDGGDWVVDGEDAYENTKRMSFLRFKELPSLIDQPLELALFLRTAADAEDRGLMERHGWRVRHSREVAGSPERYQAYIRDARGEFSCAKPSCIKFQNAWVSDRTLCYLASGKPVVVQDTGPSRYLPNGEGMFRFSTLDQAAAAVAAINADYARHSRAARSIAETYFDAKQVVGRILEIAAG